MDLNINGEFDPATYYNSPELNKIIALKNDSFIVSIASEYTQYDVSFSLVKLANENLYAYHHGIGTQEDGTLVVAIIGKSAFAFTLSSAWTAPSYVAQKLGITEGDMVIAEQIADIIAVFKDRK